MALLPKHLFLMFGVYILFSICDDLPELPLVHPNTAKSNIDVEMGSKFILVLKTRKVTNLY